MHFVTWPAWRFSSTWDGMSKSIRDPETKEDQTSFLAILIAYRGPKRVKCKDLPQGPEFWHPKNIACSGWNFPRAFEPLQSRKYFWSPESFFLMTIISTGIWNKKRIWNSSIPMTKKGSKSWKLFHDFLLQDYDKVYQLYLTIGQEQ